MISLIKLKENIMIKKVFVHIGLHKTGSSSIQQSLRYYDDGSTFYAELGFANHSEPLISAFSSNFLEYRNFIKMGFEPEKIKNLKKSTLDKLNSEIKKNRNQMILSGEDLSDLKEADIRKLLNFFKEKNIELVIVAYIRNPKDWRMSIFQQKIKGGERDLQKAFAENFRSIKRLQRFKSVFESSNVVIKNFSRSKLRNGCVVEDFCAQVNIDPPKQIINANESLSLSAIKLLFLFNNSVIVSSGNQDIIKARFKLINLLRDLYNKDKSLDPRFFSTSNDPKILKNIFKEFKIRFDNIPDDPKFNLKNLEFEITDVSNVDLDPLDKWLKKERFNSDLFKSPESKLSAIFYKLMMNTYYFAKISNKT